MNERFKQWLLWVFWVLYALFMLVLGMSMARAFSYDHVLQGNNITTVVSCDGGEGRHRYYSIVLVSGNDSRVVDLWTGDNDCEEYIVFGDPFLPFRVYEVPPFSQLSRHEKYLVSEGPAMLKLPEARVNVSDFTLSFLGFNYTVQGVSSGWGSGVVDVTPVLDVLVGVSCIVFFVLSVLVAWKKHGKVAVVFFSMGLCIVLLRLGVGVLKWM